MTDETLIAERRRRYLALEASGQAPKRLPGPSARPAPSAADATLIHAETIPGGWYWTTALQPGDTLRLQTDAAGPSAVSLLAWCRADPSERLNTADTIKVQWTAALGRGRVIFSDMGRVMLSIIEDSCGWHDALVGGSTARPGGGRNTRDNFLLAAQKLGLGTRDIPPCITFFSPVRVGDDGRFTWTQECRTAGDYVDLRAEMPLWVALSNCPHPLDPASEDPVAPVHALRFRGDPASDDDLCRTATDEARRGFVNTAALTAGDPQS